MTVIVTDKTIRKTSVPFVATAFSTQFGSSFDYIQISDGTWTASPLAVMRMSKPERGNLTQAYLNLFMYVASAISVKVAIGRFDTDGINKITPTQAEIDASHLKLTGTSSAIASSGTSLIVDGLNLLSQIPKQGTSTYNSDGFVLILQFSRSLVEPDEIKRFEVSCAMEMGLL